MLNFYLSFAFVEYLFLPHQLPHKQDCSSIENRATFNLAAQTAMIQLWPCSNATKFSIIEIRTSLTVKAL